MQNPLFRFLLLALISISTALTVLGCQSTRPYNRMLRAAERPADMILVSEVGRANTLNEDMKDYFSMLGFESVPLSECTFQDHRSSGGPRYDELEHVKCLACVRSKGRFASAQGCNTSSQPEATVCMGRLAGKNGGRILYDWTDTRYKKADQGPMCKADIEALEKFLEPRKERWQHFKSFLERAYGETRVTWAQTVEEAITQD